MRLHDPAEGQLFDASVEVALRDIRDPEDAVAELEAFDPTFSRSDRGWTVAEVKVTARSVEQATRMAIAVVVTALDAEALACEVRPAALVSG